MKQQALAMAADQGSGFEHYRRPPRRELFLHTREQLVPWSVLCAVIEPSSPKAGKGRPPAGLERMLRMSLAQPWFNLADQACEEALLDGTGWRGLVGIDLGRERAPDARTLLKFGGLWEKHELGADLFAEVNAPLQARGVKVGTGTIVDARIIGAPSWTKNAAKAADPDMHRTGKGQPWYFGMKMHIGVDSRTGRVHGAAVTAANGHAKHLLEDLLHGQERRVYGDSAYASQKASIREPAPQAGDLTNQRMGKGADVEEGERSRNRNQSRIRARVEHVLAVVKRLWGFAKVRYRGLDEHANRSVVPLGPANLSLAPARWAA
ncbi:IS5 family transposase [Xanthomonas theicola]|uniref:IS5/IS1182 family transposase n=1 Tax=Xanthomonas theicola TaxID=56464 RepID=A0A2S6Z6B3_9XANT|nr:IS5 family transposase [Xanthomonas theicola]PPT77030.1 IS5/IS1182 family transposase [Xanthomonas theicola]QNH26549.1 IS5 family transposase [Xanthomonas theicola]